MRVFFRNYVDDIGISSQRPLEGSMWQVREIFKNLPEDDGSFLGLMDEKNEVIQFSKYNKYVWLVEVPKPQKGGAKQGFYTKSKCLRLIDNLFTGTKIDDIKGLNFEKYL